MGGGHHEAGAACLVLVEMSECVSGEVTVWPSLSQYSTLVATQHTTDYRLHYTAATSRLLHHGHQGGHTAELTRPGGYLIIGNK